MHRQQKRAITSNRQRTFGQGGALAAAAAYMVTDTTWSLLQNGHMKLVSSGGRLFLATGFRLDFLRPPMLGALRRCHQRRAL